MIFKMHFYTHTLFQEGIKKQKWKSEEVFSLLEHILVCTGSLEKAYIYLYVVCPYIYTYNMLPFRQYLIPLACSNRAMT